jgi:hypothetical protein
MNSHLLWGFLFYNHLTYFLYCSWFHWRRYSAWYFLLTVTHSHLVRSREKYLWFQPQSVPLWYAKFIPKSGLSSSRAISWAWLPQNPSSFLATFRGSLPPQFCSSQRGVWLCYVVLPGCSSTVHPQLPLCWDCHLLNSTVNYYIFVKGNK